MSAAAVRAGKAFVEITANDTQFQRAMKRVQHNVVRMGNMLRQVGSGMALAGTAMGLPMVLAARQAASLEDAMLELKGAVSEITPEQLKRVREETMKLSRALGESPAKIGQAFALLIKAGMKVEDALNGGARAAMEFAAVSGVEAKDAAEFMKVAMNVFEVSATEAADTLSAAADSSETSIAAMVESFSLVASVAKGTGQTLFGLSQGLAALARYGIKGEEAGTGIKTLLIKLLSPADDAREAMASLGISMESLVDSSGKLLPLAQIAKVFRDKLGGMSKEARDAMLANEALVKIFDVRGIRVIQAFADIGEDGFNDIATAMENSRTVSEKYNISMAGITGATKIFMSAVERLSDAFWVGLSPAFGVVARGAAFLIDKLSWLLESVPIISPILATMAAAMFGLGTAALVAGGFLSFMNFGLKGIINAKTTYALAMRVMTAATWNFTRSLAAMSAAIYAIPGWGWALAAIALVVGGVAWAMGAFSTKEPKSKKSGIKRDKDREPLGAGGAAPAAAQARGATIGTFASSIAAQLGIGPSLTAAEQTADNTARIADGVDELVQRNGAGVPPAANLQAGIDAPRVARGVTARSDTDLVSVSERTAAAAEQTNRLLERMAAGGYGTVAFA